MLKNCKSLDMNDFLHNFYLYVINRPHIESRPWTTSQQSDLSFGTLPEQTFVEFDIFRDNQENAGL